MIKEEAVYRLNALLTMCDFRDAFGDRVDSKPYEDAVAMAIEALREQKTGKWIIFPPFIEEICMCSNCKTKFKEAYQHRNICPNCGARMETNNEN